MKVELVDFAIFLDDHSQQKVDLKTLLEQMRCPGKDKDSQRFFVLNSSSSSEEVLDHAEEAKSSGSSQPQAACVVY